MTPEAITQLVQTGQLTHKQAIDLFSALYGASLPSSALRYPCEQCGQLVSHDQAHSYQVNACMPGDGRVAGFQCAALQHFACSESCARALTIKCLDEHMLPQAQARRAQADAAAIAASENAGSQNGE